MNADHIFLFRHSHPESIHNDPRVPPSAARGRRVLRQRLRHHGRHRLPQDPRERPQSRRLPQLLRAVQGPPRLRLRRVQGLRAQGQVRARHALTHQGPPQQDPQDREALRHGLRDPLARAQRGRLPQHQRHCGVYKYICYLFIYLFICSAHSIKIKKIIN
jgi:hypothetical protein